MVSRIATLRQIDSVATRIITSTDVSSISQGSVSLRHYLSGREEVVKDVAAVFWIGRQKARNELHAALKAAGVDRVRLVGDAFAPRRLPIALVEAHSLARTI